MNTYKEEAIQFGRGSTLLGVVTRPSGHTSNSLACLMFNFGVTHRVGPRRIQVKMARRLAEEGFATLRFDLSGLGDSQSAEASSLSFEEQATHDLRAAIDEVEKRLGIRQVVIFGLCSGAAHGLRIALDDPRTVGLLSFDGYAFTSQAANVERRVRRFLRFPKAQISHWIDRLLGRDRPDGDLLKTGVRAKIMTPAVFAGEMETLIERGVSIYLIYSGSLQQRDRNHDQMYPLRGAPFLQKVRYEFMPKVDHSFTEIAGQQMFMDAACRWIEDIEAKRINVPSSAAVPAADERAPERTASALAVA
jgi:dienelactone hydrolase